MQRPVTLDDEGPVSLQLKVVCINYSLQCFASIKINCHLTSMFAEPDDNYTK